MDSPVAAAEDDDEQVAELDLADENSSYAEYETVEKSSIALNAQDETTELQNDYSNVIQLYMKKCEERSHAVESALDEADNVLHHSSDVDPPQNTNSDSLLDDDRISSDVIIHVNSTVLKSPEEIEDANRAALESLEKLLLEQERDQALAIKKEKELELQSLVKWEEKDSKMQKDLELMIDKEKHWEKTLYEIAEEELNTKGDTIQDEYSEAQSRITDIQEKERKILQDLLEDMEQLKQEKNTNAVLTIQTFYRGYCTRKQHGDAVRERVKAAKERHRLERIAALEAKKKMEEEATRERMAALEGKKKIEEEDAKERRRLERIAALEEKKEMEERITSVDEQKMTEQVVEESDGPERNAPLEEISEMDKVESAEKEIDDNKRTRTNTLNQKQSNTITVSSDLELNSDDNALTGPKSLVSQNPGELFIPMCDVQNTEVLDQDDAMVPSHDITEQQLHGFEMVHNAESGIVSYVEENATGEAHEKVEGGIEKFVSPGHIPIPDCHTIQGVRDSEMDNGSNKIGVEEPPPSDTKLPKNTKLPQAIPPESIRDTSPHAIGEQSELARTNQKRLPDLTLKGTQEYPHGNSVDADTPPNSIGQLKCQTGENDNPADLPVAHPSSTEQNALSKPEPHKDDAIKAACKTEKCDDVTEISNKEACTVQNDLCSSGKAENKIACLAEQTLKFYEEGGSQCPYENHQQEPAEDISRGDRKVHVTEGSKFAVEGSSTEALSTLVDHPNKDLPQECPTDQLSVNSQPRLTDDATILPVKKNAELDTEVGKEAVSSNSILSPKEPPQESMSDSSSGGTEHQKLGGDKFTEQSRNTTRESKAHSSIDRSQQSPNMPKHESVTRGEGEEQPTQVSTDEVEPTSCAITEQRHLWLEHFQNLPKTPPISDPVRRRKVRIPRVTSAAKRLLPFSEEEIFEGAYYCDKNKHSGNLSSVDEVMAIMLSNISGGRNLHSVAICTHLTCLTVENCGLVALDGLQACEQLQTVNVSKNAITVVSCCGMKNLQSLDLSHNKLTSIHGLTGCDGLLYVDVSFNHITRLSGLEDITSLLHLRISNNQLNSLSGIQRCSSLLYLDVSENHILSLDDLAHCSLLCYLNSAGNNLNDISEHLLSNAVLLTKVDVSRNSIDALSFGKATWLPVLSELDASINRVGEEAAFPNLSLCAPSLQRLCLSKNVIMDAENLYSTLEKCRSLHTLDLSDNPCNTLQQVTGDIRALASSNFRRSHHLADERIRPFCPLYMLTRNLCQQAQYTELDSSVMNHVHKHLTDLVAEVSRHAKELQRCLVRYSGKQGENQPNPVNDAKCNSNILNVHTLHLQKLKEISGHYRLVYESPDMCVDVSQTISKKQEVENTVSSTSQLDKIELSPEATHPKTIDSSKHTKNATTADCMAVESSSLKSKSQKSFLGTAHAIGDAHHTHEHTPTKAGSESNHYSDSAIVFQKLHRRNNAGAMESYAATRIQSFWRGCHVRKVLNRVKASREAAAVKIQAVWRGHQSRCKMQKALKALGEQETNVQEDLQDINLDSFDFDEASFDDCWVYEVASKVLPHENNIPASLQRPTQFSTVQNEFPNAQLGWMDTMTSKPPLPPLSLRQARQVNGQYSETHSVDESITHSESKRSMKQKVINDEWGIKSSRTEELMMRRARRMKGGKRKNLTADQKYHRFKQKVDNTGPGPGQITPKSSSNAGNKIDYFKAREMGLHPENQRSRDEEAQKQQYTYEWLHSQVGVPSQYNSNTRSPPKGKRSKSGFFPPLPSSPSLVGIQDLEVVSVNSRSTCSTKSKERLRAIVDRHNPHR